MKIKQDYGMHIISFGIMVFVMGAFGSLFASEYVDQVREDKTELVLQLSQTLFNLIFVAFGIIVFGAYVLSHTQENSLDYQLKKRTAI